MSKRADLVAKRLRAGAGWDEDPDRRLASFALEHEIASDLGHVHATHNLAALPIAAAPGRLRPVVLLLRRFARRSAYPLPEAQASWNGAAARVMSFMIHQLAVQARVIESLERQVAKLQDDARSEEQD